MPDLVRDQAARPEKVGEIVFPPEWLLGRSWLFTEVLVRKELPDGLAIIGGGVLNDGTNLLGMTYPGGQRLFRAAPPDWVKETRKTGAERPDLDSGTTGPWHGKHRTTGDIAPNLYRPEMINA